jgi:hypothetical protein
MFSSVRKAVIHRAFAKAASLLLDRTLYYMNRRFFGTTVTNTFVDQCIKSRSPPDASLRVLRSQHINSNRQDIVNTSCLGDFYCKGDHELVRCF